MVLKFPIRLYTPKPKKSRFTPLLYDTLAYLRAYEIIYKRRPTTGDLKRFYRVCRQVAHRRVVALRAMGFVKCSPCGGYGFIVTEKGKQKLRSGE